MDIQILLLLAGSYLVGSLPIGYLVARRAGIDIRKKGSGNIGATNILRTLGKKSAALTLVLDMLKGLLPVIAARQWYAAPSPIPVWAGLTAITGHNFSVFLKFRGGKGVATTAGVFLGLSPVALLAALLFWTAVFLFWKIISLASISAALFLPLFLIIYDRDQPFLAGLAGLLAAMIIYTHRTNIKRLFNRREPRLSPWKQQR